MKQFNSQFKFPNQHFQISEKETIKKQNNVKILKVLWKVKIAFFQLQK